MYECVCGCTFKRWGLVKHEQTIKHKTFIKPLGLEEEGEYLSNVAGVNDPLIGL